MPFSTTNTTPSIKKSHNGGLLEQSHSRNSKLTNLGHAICQRLVVSNFIKRLRKAKPDQQTQIQPQTQTQLDKPGPAPRRFRGVEHARVKALRLEAAGRRPKGFSAARQCRLGAFLHKKALLAARGPAALRESLLVQGEEEEVVIFNVPNLGRNDDHVGGTPSSQDVLDKDGAFPTLGLAIRTREGAAVSTTKQYNKEDEIELHPGVWMKL